MNFKRGANYQINFKNTFTNSITVIILFFFLSNISFGQNLKLETEAMYNPMLNQGIDNLPNSMAMQDTVLQSDTSNNSAVNDLASLSLSIKPKLLPDHISFMENFLWGENGFMRKVGIAGPLNAESRKDELQARRTMLSIHQVTGLTTLGLMLATDYFGQKVLDGRRDLSGTHKTFVAFTIGTYALTGLLAVLAPPPMIRRDNSGGTTQIHKILAWVHFAGMILTPILGSLVVNHRAIDINKGHFHQISAYATTAVFAASVIVLTF